ncbi:Enolase 2 [Vitis vinifera]|uniref:phosphopyruvate hydratase n=1 Tax=Vitis vinifera TaxID=29760 RepID=A0A438JSP7_VITVI|nr:Enolase 2 [Vitis vinifera]
MVTIQFVKARQIFDSRGNPTVEVDIGLSNGAKVSAAVPSGASTGKGIGRILERLGAFSFLRSHYLRSLLTKLEELFPIIFNNMSTLLTFFSCYLFCFLGIYEALELRDGGSDYLGKGVSKAVANVNTIIGPALIGKDPSDQTGIDNFMVQQLDGTVNEWGWCKQKLGANAILAVSLAVCKAGAIVKNIPLYKVFLVGLLGTDITMSFEYSILQTLLATSTWCCRFLHSMSSTVVHMQEINSQCRHALDITFDLFLKDAPWLRFIHLCLQEFMILPIGAPSFKEAMKMGVEVYHHLKAVIKKKYGQDATNVGDEGGFAPNIQENKEGLELLKTAIAKAGYTKEVNKTYDLNFKEENNDGSEKISGDALKNLYKSFVNEYPISSIEDPFDQDDWEHYTKLTCEIGEKVQIVGDDLLVTNPKRVEKAIKEKACNALLLKVNQIGTVTESIEAVKMSKRAGWGVMASHRSGETEDTFIADLSVGLATGQIKTGAPCRSERLAKYNQLLRIEEELGADAVYAGANFRKPVEPY